LIKNELFVSKQKFYDVISSVCGKIAS